MALGEETWLGKPGLTEWAPTLAEWHSVSSTNVHSIRMPTKDTLQVRFHKGGIVTDTYEYSNCDVSVFYTMLKTGSKGRFVNYVLRRGLYAGRKI